MVGRWDYSYSPVTTRETVGLYMYNVYNHTYFVSRALQKNGAVDPLIWIAHLEFLLATSQNQFACGELAALFFKFSMHLFNLGRQG
jgi:hypothetical protein